MDVFAGLQKVVPKSGGKPKEAFIFHFELEPMEERFLSFNSIVVSLLCSERKTSFRLAFKNTSATHPFERVVNHVLSLPSDLLESFFSASLWLARFGLEKGGELRTKYFSFHALFPLFVMENSSYLAVGDVDALLQLSHLPLEDLN